MKKRKLLVLFMAAACMAMPLSACNETNEQDAALSALKENFVWTDGSKTYTNVKRIDGTVVDSDAEHNLLAVKTEQANTVYFKVVDLTTGENVSERSFSYSSTSSYTFDVEIEYPLIKYVQNFGGDSQTQYEYYLAKRVDNGYNNGSAFTNSYSYEQASVREFDGLYELKLKDEVVWVDEELNVLRKLNTIVTGDYHLNEQTFKASFGGYLYTWRFGAAGRMIQVYNTEGVCSMQYNFPSDVVVVGSHETMEGVSNAYDPNNLPMDVHVLNNGNLLVQEWANVTEGTYNFKNTLSGQKFKITTKVIDRETGKATVVKNFNYFVNELARASADDHDFPFDLAKGKQNQAYLTPFTVLGIGSTTKYAVMDNNGKVSYTFKNTKLDRAGYGDNIEILSDKYYMIQVQSAEEEYEYDYLVYDVSGKQVLQLPLNELDIKQAALTSTLYVTQDGIYNYSKECVYSFATSEFNSSRYDYEVEIMSDGVYLWVADYVEEKEFCYHFNEDTKKMEVFMTEGEEDHVKITDNFMVLEDEQNGTYTLYNNKGTALLKTQGNSDVQQSGQMNVVELDGYLYVQAEINGNPVIYLVD